MKFIACPKCGCEYASCKTSLKDLGEGPTYYPEAFLRCADCKHEFTPPGYEKQTPKGRGQ